MRRFPLSLAALATLFSPAVGASSVESRLLRAFGEGNGALPSLPQLPAGTSFAVGIGSGIAAQPLLQAGHPSPGTPGVLPDNPGLRIDPNLATSPFSGVGSLFIDSDPSDAGGFICTGTPISRTSILTAAHCFDIDGDGRNDVEPANTLFVLNHDSDYSHIIPAAGIVIHPDFTGFSKPSVNDDLTVVLLSQPLPPEIPIYQLADPSWLLPGSPLLMVGYGDSGTGNVGYDVEASFSVKRLGANLAEAVNFDDEGSAEIEVVAWDFEYEGNNIYHPVTGQIVGNSDDYLGVIAAALPNRIESTIGGGDSGGPSFMFNPLDPGDLQPYLAAVNTFSFWNPYLPGHDKPGVFGSGGGAIWLNDSYRSWIATIPDRTSPLLDVGLASLAMIAGIRLFRPTPRSSEVSSTNPATF